MVIQLRNPPKARKRIERNKRREYMTFFMARPALKLPLKTKVNIDREISPGRNTNHQENRLASDLSNN
jgi:hypothetical protein